ncbi:MAG: nucleoside hydrolase [Flavobacteriaceae bacterium]|nr:MAG: nucleoside hydrolase [Flavobacteriaceae bacterium]
MKKIAFLVFITLQLSCKDTKKEQTPKPSSTKMEVIFDTDANNELDDQHALAYLFSNRDIFDIKAITVNATHNGGNINGHYEEAARIMTLFKVRQEIQLLKGADKDFLDIEDDITNTTFDGFKAVNYIITEAKKPRKRKLVVIAVGKLTNLALALKKEPSIASNIRLVWLGANYPDPGEYNLVNDIPSMNFVLNTDVDFEMVTVRYGKPSGTDAVKITQIEASQNMPGLGPIIDKPIVGRHGGEFFNFGDYAVNLFTHIDYHGDPPSRALFDMAAVAIVKNPEWAKSKKISCPTMIGEKWLDQPNNQRKITLWEYFEKDAILADFYASLK